MPRLAWLGVRGFDLSGSRVANTHATTTPRLSPLAGASQSPLRVADPVLPSSSGTCWQ